MSLYKPNSNTRLNQDIFQFVNSVVYVYLKNEYDNQNLLYLGMRTAKLTKQLYRFCQYDNNFGIYKG